MATITTDQIKELRAATGAGILECRKALQETDGDVDKAVVELRKKGIAAAAKRAGNAANEGAIAVENDGKKGTIVEIDCETDFVSGNDGFKKFLGQVLAAVHAGAALDSDEVSKLKDEAVLALKENIVLKAAETLVAGDNAWLGQYVHYNGKAGVIVEVACEAGVNDTLKEVARELGFQLVGGAPQALHITPGEVSAEIQAKEREIGEALAKEAGKTGKGAEMMAEGKVKRYFKDYCLLNQPFVKDNKKTISAWLDEKAKEAGGKISVKRFVRYTIG